MGMFSFIGNVGRKVGEITGVSGSSDAAARVTAAKAVAAAAQATAAGQQKAALHLQSVAADIAAAIASHGLAVRDLAVEFDGLKVTLKGAASTQADAEKAVLVAGNTEGVTQVDDQLTVDVPAKPAVHHTVVKGDSLSAIAGRYYGVMRMFDAIFEANKPMLTHPDKIYPGQVLRIPPVTPPTHTVAKGETLGSIAKHWYGNPARYKDIAAASGITNPDVVEVGKVLTIPLIDAKV